MHTSNIPKNSEMGLEVPKAFGKLQRKLKREGDWNFEYAMFLA